MSLISTEIFVSLQRGALRRSERRSAPWQRDSACKKRVTFCHILRMIRFWNLFSSLPSEWNNVQQQYQPRIWKCKASKAIIRQGIKRESFIPSNIFRFGKMTSVGWHINGRCLRHLESLTHPARTNESWRKAREICSLHETHRISHHQGLFFWVLKFAQDLLNVLRFNFKHQVIVQSFLQTHGIQCHMASFRLLQKNNLQASTLQFFQAILSPGKDFLSIDSAFSCNNHHLLGGDHFLQTSTKPVWFGDWGWCLPMVTADPHTTLQCAQGSGKRHSSAEPGSFTMNQPSRCWKSEDPSQTCSAHFVAIIETKLKIHLESWTSSGCDELVDLLNHGFSASDVNYVNCHLNLGLQLPRVLWPGFQNGAAANQLHQLHLLWYSSGLVRAPLWEHMQAPKAQCVAFHWWVGSFMVLVNIVGYSLECLTSMDASKRVREPGDIATVSPSQSKVHKHILRSWPQDDFCLPRGKLALTFAKHIYIYIYTHIIYILNIYM